MANPMTTTLSWPSRLPLPTFDGMSVEPQDACLRTEMEAGPARTRRRFTQVPTRIPVRWRFGPVDFATFEARFRLKRPMVLHRPARRDRHGLA